MPCSSSPKANRLRAEPLFLKAIALELKGLGPNHPDRSHTLNSYAGLLRAKKDAAGSEAMHREALRIREAAYARRPRARSQPASGSSMPSSIRTSPSRPGLNSEVALAAVSEPSVDLAVRARVVTRGRVLSI